VYLHSLRRHLELVGRVVSRRGKDVEDLYGGDGIDGEAPPALTSPRATGYTAPSGRVESGSRAKKPSVLDRA
jgi:hypothetical protein